MEIELAKPTVKGVSIRCSAHLQAESAYVGYPTLDDCGTLRATHSSLRVMKIRILIADDHAVARKQLTALLETHAGWKVCGGAENGQEAVVKAAELKPDLIILDLSMPVMDGLWAAREIAAIMPKVPILMYTQHNYLEIELEAKKFGVRRVVSKTDDRDELFSAIDAMLSSEPSVPAGSNAALASANQLCSVPYRTQFRPLQKARRLRVSCVREGLMKSTSSLSASAEESVFKSGLSGAMSRYRDKQIIYSQGETATTLFCIRKGDVMLSVRSKGRRQAVITVLGAGDFFGQSCLAGVPLRMSTATAIGSSSILTIEKEEMIRILREDGVSSNVFVSYLLSVIKEYQEHLADLLVNSAELRLARVLLRLAKLSPKGEGIPKISHRVLADMVGTTRARTSALMNRFRRQGLIAYNGGIKVHSSLRTR
jgi:CRP/FNR family cyclic AMP-dependent transcriptional regulator